MPEPPSGLLQEQNILVMEHICARRRACSSTTLPAQSPRPVALTGSLFPRKLVLGRPESKLTPPVPRASAGRQPPISACAHPAVSTTKRSG